MIAGAGSSRFQTSWNAATPSAIALPSTTAILQFTTFTRLALALQDGRESAEPLGGLLLECRSDELAVGVDFVLPRVAFPWRSEDPPT
ncbi:MAG: hypothetical protein AB7J32_21235 [Pseudonocardia sp.]